MQTVYLIILLILITLPKPAMAVLPPDLIVSVGAQVGQFFAFISLFFVGMFGGLVYLVRNKLTTLAPYSKYIWPTLAFLLGLLISSVYHNAQIDNDRNYLNYLEILDNRIDKVIRNQLSEYQSIEAVATTSQEAWSDMTDQKLFRSDTILLFGEVENDPFYLEIDMNRKQTANGDYLHYYFIEGTVSGQEVSGYQSSQSSSSIPQVGAYIKQMDKLRFSDLSTREEYLGTVTVEDVEVSFKVTDLIGDFITKNTPDYTRYQSVGQAVVAYGEKEYVVQAMVEGIHSNDFSESIFFNGSTQIKADTYQFALWDEANNFYLIDQSEVYTNSPKYKSHTWLLMKSHETGLTKKVLSPT
ncbi:MAG: hypothetical protein R3B53_04740 [Candidatus Paceibacterota bacterium]